MKQNYLIDTYLDVSVILSENLLHSTLLTRDDLIGIVLEDQLDYTSCSICTVIYFYIAPSLTSIKKQADCAIEVYN